MDVPREGPRASRRTLVPVAAVVLVFIMMLVVTRRGRSASEVEYGSINVDTVKRGWFVREVRAAGTLIPEQVRWIAALSAGRVERLHVQAGARVQAGAVLLEMTNPDVRLEVLEAERQLAAAEAALMNLQSSFETQKLTQAGAIASVRSQQREAARQATAKSQLVKQQLITPMEAALALDQSEELTTRVAIEEQRLAILSRAATAQVQVQRAEIGRLREIVAFQRARHEAMTVRASQAGLVQEIPSETGQWINPGETLVKMQAAGRLKAVLRVPEAAATDVSPGQPVLIDTRNGTVQGRVVRVNPGVQGGVVLVDVALPDSLPRGARPDLSIDGVIEVERVANALHVGRSPDAEPERTVTLYKLAPNGKDATRASVAIGRVSTTRVEIQRGLREGDVVIISKLPVTSETERIRISR